MCMFSKYTLNNVAFSTTLNVILFSPTVFNFRYSLTCKYYSCFKYFNVFNDIGNSSTYLLRSSMSSDEVYSANIPIVSFSSNADYSIEI
jgi:hypothetical protein